MRRRRIVRARNNVRHAIDMAIAALYAAWAALNPNTWRNR
jgi:hypothetical protein